MKEAGHLVITMILGFAGMFGVYMAVPRIVDGLHVIVNYTAATH